MNKKTWAVVVCLMGLVSLPILGQAKVVSTHIQDGMFAVTLPRVTEAPEAVSDQVNVANNEMIRAVTELLQHHSDAVAANLRFQKTFENKNYLSLFYYGHVDDGSDYGLSVAKAVVINKKTGALVPLSHFTSMTVGEMNTALLDKKLSMTSADTGKVLEYLNMWPAEEMTSDYYLTNKGEVVLVYPALAMGPQSYDIVLVTLPKIKIK